MHFIERRTLSALLLVACVGCRPTPPARSDAGPPSVPVSRPVQREVIDTVEYTGRTDAVESVGIRARVTGYLTNAPFKEGSEVKKGDLLFEIDPRPYQAQYDQALSQVRVAESQAVLGKSNLVRLQSLAGGAASQLEQDQAKAAAGSADATLKAAEATAEVYRLNLEYSKVYSPIAGRVSRYYFTAGNLVSQDQTLLTTVVSVDRMYTYFDMDERTLHKLTVGINAGRIPPPESGKMSVAMGIDGEEGFPHAGTVDFLNNVVNPATGTVAVRAVFPNPEPPNGNRVLRPGMFARVNLPLGRPRPALLVVDRAVGSDQGLKYVYVIDAEKKVQYRKVTVGPLQEGGLRVVETGLKPDDWVVVGALQQLRSQAVVSPQEGPMPTGDAAPPAPPQTPPQTQTKG
jgi:multidrug efflux system membrane fusion protein